MTYEDENNLVNRDCGLCCIASIGRATGATTRGTVAAGGRDAAGRVGLSASARLECADEDVDGITETRRLL